MNLSSSIAAASGAPDRLNLESLMPAIKLYGHKLLHTTI